MIFEILHACQVLGIPGLFDAEIAVTWTIWIGHILLLAAVMISLAGAMYKASKPGSVTVIYAVGGVGVGFVSIIMIAYCGVASRFNSTIDDFGDSSAISRQTLVNIKLALHIFYSLAALLAIAELIALLVMMHGKFSTLLCLMLFGNSIIGVIEPNRAKHNMYDTFAGYVAYLLFSDLFIFLLFTFINHNKVINAALNDPTGLQIGELAPGHTAVTWPSRNPSRKGSTFIPILCKDHKSLICVDILYDLKRLKSLSPGIWCL
jgi:hypothetical protein